MNTGELAQSALGGLHAQAQGFGLAFHFLHFELQPLGLRVQFVSEFREPPIDAGLKFIEAPVNSGISSFDVSNLDNLHRGLQRAGAEKDG